jgi:hypothetical protein
MKDINIKFWYPAIKFPFSPSFPASFLQAIGGNNFSNLWTKRNLYILSKIFAGILNYSDDNLKKQLLFGFIQTLHLCSKMSIPRRQESNRPFSTSWGAFCISLFFKTNGNEPFNGFSKQLFRKTIS